MNYNKKISLVILWLIAFLVAILGIVWLYKINMREGLTEAENALAKKAADQLNRAMGRGGPAKPPPRPKPTAESMEKLSASFMTQFEAAGVDTPSSEDFDNLFTQLTKLVTAEVAAASNRQGALSAAELTTPVENTVAPVIPFPDTTFFTGTKFGDAFCPTYGKNPAELNNKCSILTSENCNATDCCIWVNGNKCIAGNETGPTDISVNQQDYDYYSYKYQCYGSCGITVGGGGGAYGGGNYSGNVDPCHDLRTIIPIKCYNDFWVNANCSIGTLALDTETTIPVPGMPQYNFTVADGNIDMSLIPNINWGTLKNIYYEAMETNPNLCLTGPNPKSIKCGSMKIDISYVNAADSFDFASRVNDSVATTAPCMDTTMTMIPNECFNQFATTTHCPYFKIPSSLINATFPISIGGSQGNVSVANNKVNLSQVSGMNWGIFQTAAQEMIQQNPGACGKSSFWPSA